MNLYLYPFVQCIKSVQLVSCRVRFSLVWVRVTAQANFSLWHLLCPGTDCSQDCQEKITEYHLNHILKSKPLVLHHVQRRQLESNHNEVSIFISEGFLTDSQIEKSNHEQKEATADGRPMAEKRKNSRVQNKIEFSLSYVNGTCSILSVTPYTYTIRLSHLGFRASLTHAFLIIQSAPGPKLQNLTTPT